jgi:hypothetical protein
MDMKRIRIDVRSIKARRPPSPIGRPKTGATDIIRNNYLEFYRMHHEDGVQWTEIAAALAAQGVTQGDGDAITGRRLTALMRNIALQIEKEEMKSAARARRSDVTRPGIEREDGKIAKLKLAPELTIQRTTDRDAVVSEDEIRRGQLERHAHLLKRK